MTNFQTMNVPAYLVQSLERMQITIPTPIQSQAIPHGLEGRDILASAQTGTGKTIAYLIPLLTKLGETPDSTALILTPTRELATQVRDSLIQLLGRRPTFGLGLLIGGEPISKQFLQLRSRPRLIIGTPGRVIDHLHRRTLNLNHTGFLVLDETDRMLDMGFHEQLKELCQFLPDERQTFMFSATMPDNITKLAHQYLKDPMRISIGSTTQPIAKIQQDIKHTTNADKFSLLLTELDAREGSIIVFVKTKRSADELVLKLQHKNHSAEAIHGDLKQAKRDRVIREFRNKRNRIMVATDIAARGLDVPHIEHVVNYDLPQCPEDYIHRIGRTGRAGAVGQAISLIAPQDGRLWRMIHNLISPGTPCDLPQGYNIAPPPRGGRRPGGNVGGGSRGGGRPGGSRPFTRGDSPSRDRSDRPRDGGGSAPRREYTPRDRDAAPREGGSAPRREYTPRDRDAAPREGGSAPRREYTPRDRDDRPRDGDSAPRREFTPRGRSSGPRVGDSATGRDYSPRGRSDAPREGGFASRRGPSTRDRSDAPREGGFASRREYTPRDRSDAPREGGFASRRESSFGDRSDAPREGGFSRSSAPRGRSEGPRTGGFASRKDAPSDGPRTGGFSRGSAPRGRSDAPREGGFASRRGPSSEGSSAGRGAFRSGGAFRGATSSRGPNTGGNAPAFSGRSSKRPASKRV
jgi:ATP-dependent RNA helicase DeaD